MVLTKEQIVETSKQIRHAVVTRMAVHFKMGYKFDKDSHLLCFVGHPNQIQDVMRKVLSIEKETISKRSTYGIAFSEEDDINIFIQKVQSSIRSKISSDPKFGYGCTIFLGPGHCYVDETKEVCYANWYRLVANT
jgi:hypothetical protein